MSALFFRFPSRALSLATMLVMALFAFTPAHGEQGEVTRLPEVTATAAELGEDAPAGAYKAPEWTGERRFPTTRVYLQQGPGDVGFEQWVRHRSFRDGTAETRFQEEVEIGLPYRFQLDLYETWKVDEHRRANQDEYSAEVRWAFADWGHIPLNPTLYFEYATVNRGANTAEGKLLLGTDITPRLHWGFNLIDEQELSHAKNTALGFSQGFSYTLIDEKLSAGIEMEYEHDKASGSPGENRFLIGPSLQARPAPWCHIDLVPLFGVTHDAPGVEAYLIFGIDFGPGKNHYAPVSLRGQ